MIRIIVYTSFQKINLLKVEIYANQYWYPKSHLLLCKSKLDLTNLPHAEEYGYHNLPLCIIDAVFSIGVRYISTENTVKRYCDYFSVTRLREKELAHFWMKPGSSVQYLIEYLSLNGKISSRCKGKAFVSNLQTMICRSETSYCKWSTRNTKCFAHTDSSGMSPGNRVTRKKSNIRLTFWPRQLHTHWKHLKKILRLIIPLDLQIWMYLRD